MFHSPWYLLFLLLLPLIAWRQRSTHAPTSIAFSSTRFAVGLRPSWRQRFLWLPSFLTLVALALTIIALARPRESRDRAIVHSEGIAIELVVDRSSSMWALDFQIDGEHVHRLAAIKHVVSKFVLGDQAETASGNTDLPGRISDLIGLITFAGYADATTPPTLDHSFLVEQLDATQIVNPQQQEDGTAIGDAISLAVEKLNRLDERGDRPIKSKIIILLTDGENTAGEFEPLQAAELAKKMELKVYTIGVGTRGRAPVALVDPRTGQPTIRWMDVNIDEETLRGIAKQTGGKYYRATNTESLQEIYKEIDLLEKTKVESTQYVDYRELAVQPMRLGGWSLPPLGLIALLVLTLRVVISQTIFRELS